MADPNFVRSEIQARLQSNMEQYVRELTAAGVDMEGLNGLFEVRFVQGDVFVEAAAKASTGVQSAGDYLKGLNKPKTHD